MQIKINYNSGEPILRQVVNQVKLLIVSGTLRAGDKLPSIRELAKDLKINPTTVSRIYSELEHEGVIVLRQGQGAFIAEPLSQRASKDVVESLSNHARTLLVEGLRSGVDLKGILQIVEEEYKKIVK